MQVFFLAALAFALLAVLFALQNIVPVRVGFLAWTFEGSLALVLFVALILGALVSLLISIPSIVKGRMTTRSLKAQIAALQAELDTREASPRQRLTPPRRSCTLTTRASREQDAGGRPHRTCPRHRRVSGRMRGVGSCATAAVVVALLSGCSAAIDPAAVTDAQTAARIKTALVNDPELGELAIEVRVVRGVAALSGRVGSQSQAERAIDLARAVPGVTGVQPNLQVGGDPPAPPAAPGRQGPQARNPPEFDPPPGLLAVGASIGWSIPNPETLKTRVSISPLIKIGRPSGLGPAIGFDWFHADLESIGGAATLTRVHVKPVMAGLGYTVAANRFSLTPSIVGGFAFNSLTVKDTGAVQGLPVEVRNSVVWRIGASAWYDASRQIAINVSTGYLMTGLRLTVLTGGRLEQRDASGDTTILHAGVAYRIF